MTKDLRSINIGLFWHSPNSANLGVGALTLSNIALIRQVCEKVNIKPVFKIFGFVDDRDIYVLGDDVSVIKLNGRQIFLPWSGLDKEISQCDLILDIGGGDSFTDIYGWKRFLFLTISKLRVLKAKVPLILSPQTIGPFNHWYTRAIAKWLTRKATIVFARDNVSYDYAVKVLAVDENKVVLSTDVAFALPYNKMIIENPSTLNVGINVSGLLFNGGYSGENEFGLTVDYPELVRKTIQFFLQEECNIFLVPHVICDEAATEDDYSVCKQLAGEFPGVKISPKFFDPIEAKTAIAKMDLFMGARMHACIAALSSGTPVIPMAYSRKFVGLFGTLGYHHTLDCLALTTDEAFNRIKRAFHTRQELEIETNLAISFTAARIDTYKDHLANLIRKIAINE